MELSTLAKTWILDVDGTLVKHNGYKTDGYDTLLDGVKEFFDTIGKDDKVILLTAREGEYLEELEQFLQENDIRYDYILSDMPMGERILVNDDKPSGLKCAYAICKERDSRFDVSFVIKENL